MFTYNAKHRQMFGQPLTYNAKHRQMFGQPRKTSNYRARHAASMFTWHNRGYVGRRRKQPTVFRMFGGF